MGIATTSLIWLALCSSLILGGCLPNIQQNGSMEEWKNARIAEWKRLGRKNALFPFRLLCRLRNELQHWPRSQASLYPCAKGVKGHSWNSLERGPGPAQHYVSHVHSRHLEHGTFPQNRLGYGPSKKSKSPTWGWTNAQIYHAFLVNRENPHWRHVSIAISN